MTMPSRDYRLTVSDADRALIEKANRGSEESLWALQKRFDQDPALAVYVGDLAGLAEHLTIMLATGEKCLAYHDGVHRQLNELKQSLGTPDDTELETLLIKRICIAWLWVYACDLQLVGAQHAASKGGSKDPVPARDADRRLDRAQARYLAAQKALAQIRQLSRQTRSPISLLQAASGKSKDAAPNKGGRDRERVPVEMN